MHFSFSRRKRWSEFVGPVSQGRFNQHLDVSSRYNKHISKIFRKQILIGRIGSLEIEMKCRIFFSILNMEKMQKICTGTFGLPGLWNIMFFWKSKLCCKKPGRKQQCVSEHIFRCTSWDTSCHPTGCNRGVMGMTVTGRLSIKKYTCDFFVHQLHRFTPTKTPPPDSHLPLGHAAFFVVNSEAYGAGTTLAISGHAGNSTKFHLPRTVPFRLLRRVGGDRWENGMLCPTDYDLKKISLEDKGFYSKKELAWFGSFSQIRR